MSIIEELKANEKPFGLMSEEMQAKARTIETTDLLVRQSNDWIILLQPLDRIKDMEDWTFSLRPDYEETKPEIVECEVTEARNGLLVFDRVDGITNCCFATAKKYPDFAGVLYKDVFGDEVYTELWLNLDKKQDGNYKVTHATHVLFQVTK